MGGTPTDEALLWVRKYLMPLAPTQRKMIVVCTDGAPDHAEGMMEEVKKCRAEQILPIGLYVGGSSNYIEKFFGKQASYSAPRREDIPLVFNKILGHLRSQ
jgi:hypothetical protein